MTPAAAGRAACLAALLGGAIAAGPAPLAAQPTSEACEVVVHASATPKLACPMESVALRFRIHTRCPVNAGNADRIGALDVAYRLPEGVVSADPLWQPLPARPVREWRIDALPATGVTLTHAIRPARPGPYALADTLHVRAELASGRTVTPTLRLVDGATITVVEACSAAPAVRAYLPIAGRAQCWPTEPAADVVLLVDRSASTAVDGTIGAVASTRAFLMTLDLTRHRAAVVAFDQDIAVLAPLGAPRPALLRALDALRPAIGTSIDDAIAAGAAVLAADGSRRQPMLVVFTDGFQTGPRGDAAVRRAADAARAAGVAILPVAVGPAPNRPLLAALAGGGAARVAEPTGEDIRRRYLDLAADVACRGRP